MDITKKYDICTELLSELRVQLGDTDKNKCVVFTPVPVIRSEYNDDLGCGTSSQLKVGDHGYYITSAAKQKRILLTDLVQKYGNDSVSSVLCQGSYLRPTEIEDSTHLPYLTQYDWEAVLSSDERTIDTLIKYVDMIWTAVYKIYCKYGNTDVFTSDTVQYVTAQELCELYPEYDPDTRVNKYMDSYGFAVLFVIGIGAELSDGRPHDHRAKDYDDYSTVTSYKGRTVTGLNGDLFVRHHRLNRVIELMSCGIRVDKLALMKQMGSDLHNPTKYHQSIIDEKYVQTIGGGLGQERTLMYILDLEDVRSTYPTLD